MNTLKVNKRKEAAIIMLNRPEFKNAVNWEMMDELERVIQELKQDNEVKVLIITGTNDSFSSGGDLAEFHQLKTSEDVRPMLEKMKNVLHQLENIGKPTIAYVNGYALGGGAEIAMSCDIRYINENAKIGFIQIGLGVTTGWGSGTRVIQKLGRSMGLSLLLTGEVLNHQKILEAKLADSFMASLEDVLKFAEKISKHSLEAIRSYVTLANEIREGVGLIDIQEKEVAFCSRLWESPDHEKAVSQFLHK